MVESLRVLVFVVVTVKGLDCEPTAPRVDCTLDNYRLLCEVTRLDTQDFSEDFEFHWHQKYKKDGSDIGVIPVKYVSAENVKQLKFEMSIQNFDNETYIYGQLKSKKTRKHFTTKKYPINIKNKKRYDVIDKITYSETKPVIFTCKNDKHSHIGWINPTVNTINIYENSEDSWDMKKQYNASMLCCLLYVSNDLTVTRYINNITRLIYEEPSTQGDTTTSTTTKQSIITEQTTSTSTSLTPDTNNVKSLRPNDDESIKTLYNHQPSVTTENAQNKNEPKPSDDLKDTQTTDQLNDLSSASDKKKYYVIIALVPGTIFVASLIYVIVKKYTRKASDPQDSRNELQLETYASTNVVYAELDMKPGTAPVPATIDSPYAEIIGVMRPVIEDIKKQNV